MLNAANTSSGSAKNKKKERECCYCYSIVKVTPRNDKAPIENCQEKKKSHSWAKVILTNNIKLFFKFY